MASFIGTNKEFRRYMGPRLRNLVQQITKSHKAEISACEHCGTKENLESAHVHGRNRNDIIDLILNNFTYNGIATVDIERFEEMFKDEHHPFEKSILILCRECHRKYDSSEPKIDLAPSTLEITEATSESVEIGDQTSPLPISLEPSDPDDFKQLLLLKKRAQIEITYNDGRVEAKSWDASNFKKTSNVYNNLRSRAEFRKGTWQKNGIVKVHVRISGNA